MDFTNKKSSRWRKLAILTCLLFAMISFSTYTSYELINHPSHRYCSLLSRIYPKREVRPKIDYIYIDISEAKPNPITVADSNWYQYRNWHIRKDPKIIRIDLLMSMQCGGGILSPNITIPYHEKYINALDRQRLSIFLDAVKQDYSVIDNEISALYIQNMPSTWPSSVTLNMPTAYKSVAFFMASNLLLLYIAAIWIRACISALHSWHSGRE